MQRFRGGTVGGYFAPMKPGMNYWSGDVTYRDVQSVNYATDGYVYRLYADPAQSIDVIKNGATAVKGMTAATNPAAYKAIMDEVQGKQSAKTALIVTAINAAALVGVTAITAGQKKRKVTKRKFAPSTVAAPPADAGIPTWVWFAGGGVVLAGIGLIVMSGRQPAKGAT
jgi:hypothetical protein